MCGRATLATLVSSTSMNVASMTVPAITHGFMSERSRTPSVKTCDVMRVPSALLGVDGGVDVHAWAQGFVAARNRIEHDLDWDSLHYFHVVPGGVLRRQQAHARTGSAGDGIHVTREFLVAQIGFHLGALAGVHLGQLRLFEVGR